MAQGAVRALEELKSLVEGAAHREAIAKDAITRMEDRAAAETEVELLAATLRTFLEGLIAWLEAAPDGLDVVTNGMLKFDSVGVNYLKEIGGTVGQEWAKQLESEAISDALKFSSNPAAHYQTVWRRWYFVEDGIEYLPQYANRLAAVLWLAHLRKTVVAESDEASSEAKQASGKPPTEKYPAVSASVLDRVVQVFFAKRWKLTRKGDETRLIGANGMVQAVASSDMGSDRSAIEGLVKCTRSLLAHRLFRFLVLFGVQQYKTAKTGSCRVITIAGGLTELAGIIGSSGSKAATELRHVLDAFAGLRLPLPHGEAASVLQWSVTAGAPGKRGSLRISLHDALLPDYVTGLPKTTRSQREARRLVPVPVSVPPLVGHPRTHAAQATLHLLLMAEMSAHAEEVFKTGWHRISPDTWAALCRDAGLRLDMLDLVREEWLRGEHGFLQQSTDDPELFALDYSSALIVIAQGGEKSAKGRARQARAAKAKKH